MIERIKSSQLTKKLVPNFDADINIINEFAHTQDMLEYTSYSKLTYAESYGNEINLSLSDLRSLLLFNQRRFNHYGDPYDAKTEEQQRKLLTLIKEKALDDDIL
jgi:hypothetical protein